MADLYKFYGKAPADREWLSTVCERSIDDCQKLLLMLGEEDSIYPFTLRLFGFHRYTPGKRIIRVANPYIIRYVISGHGRFNGIPITRGDCYVSIPGRKYEIESDSDDPLVHYWFEMLGKQAPLYVEHMLGSTEPGVYPIPQIDQCESVLYELLFGDHRQKDLSAYCQSVFFHLLSLHRRSEQTPPPVSKTLAMYMEAVNYIESHYTEQIKVTDLCEHLHIVPDYLYKIFRRYSGLSTQEYIINSKMKMASVLLSTTDDPIAEIADMVGYNEPGRFTKIFRSVYGVTPTRYRKEKV